MDHLTIQLVSNASLNLYPDNSLSSFKNFLPEQIQLDGSWEVALDEIYFPSMMKNVVDGSFKVGFVENNEEHFKPSHFNRNVPLAIPPGHYDSLKEIFDAINKTLLETYLLVVEFIHDGEEITVRETPSSTLRLPKLDFTLDDISNILTATIETVETFKLILQFGDDLSAIFGFSPNQYVQNGSQTLFPVDMMAGRHCMYAYVDIIENGIIGDVKTPLLRTIPIISKMRKNEGVYCSQTGNYRSFNMLQFRKILKHNFHSVAVRLCDTTGNPMPFTGVGQTILSLNFRKI